MRSSKTRDQPKSIQNKETMKTFYFVSCSDIIMTSYFPIRDDAFLKLPGRHSTVKNTGGGAGSIVWGLRFWLEKIFWGSSKILIWTIVRG